MVTNFTVGYNDAAIVQAKVVVRQPTRRAGAMRGETTPLGPEQMQVSPSEVQVLLFVVLPNTPSIPVPSAVCLQEQCDS